MKTPDKLPAPTPTGVAEFFALKEDTAQEPHPETSKLLEQVKARAVGQRPNQFFSSAHEALDTACAMSDIDPEDARYFLIKAMAYCTITLASIEGREV